MAISDIKEYAHLTDADVEAIGRDLDAIRRDIEESRGARDARYLRNTIRLQRGLELGGRAVLFGSRKRPLWVLGTGMLSLSKIIENMELGHNVMHGQWDWMNDPEVHSVNWEWDNADPSAHWKIPTTTCTTNTPTSSAWTTTWDSACSASPVTSAGSRSTSATSPTTRCSRCCSSTASPSNCSSSAK